MNWHEAGTPTFCPSVGRKHPYRLIAERTLRVSGPEPYMCPLEASLKSMTSAKESQNSVTL